MIRPEDIKGTDEKAEQIRLFTWASLARPEYPQLKWLHAIPNANSHRQVAEGVRAGVADVFLPYPQWNEAFHMPRWWHGLYIELKLAKRLKEKNGGLSPDQLSFGEDMINLGYRWYVAYGWEDARDRIMEYLK